MYNYNPSVHIFFILLALVSMDALFFRSWEFLIVGFMLGCAKWIILDIQRLWFLYCTWYTSRTYRALAAKYEQRLRKSDYTD